jgi:hypothetical protein
VLAIQKGVEAGGSDGCDEYENAWRDVFDEAAEVLGEDLGI